MNFLKVAVTVFAAVIVTTQSLVVFVQATLQPEKIKPAPATAVRVTTVLSKKLSS